MTLLAIFHCHNNLVTSSVWPEITSWRWTGSGGTIPYFLECNVGWRWVISLTFWPFTSSEGGLVLIG